VKVCVIVSPQNKWAPRAHFVQLGEMWCAEV
jgi:hypothetical protein